MEEVKKRYIFGYEIKIEKKKQDYIATIDELNIIEKSQSLGSCIRLIFKKVDEKVKQSKIEIDHNLEYHKNVQVRMFNVNQKITKFGFAVIAEDIRENDMNKLEIICSNIDLTKEYTSEEKYHIENSIADIMVNYILSTQIRAINMVSLIMNTKHINKFSYLIEQAYINLYRGEYISTIMILTPVIEGILLDLFEFDYTNNRLPDKNKLLNKWVQQEYDYKIPQMTHPCIIDEYIRSFIEIWELTFFSQHELSGENSYFNRNYIAHMMGNEKFYSRNNALKLINLVDLMVHVLASCNGQHNRFTFDLNNKSYCDRLNYYKSLIKVNLIDETRYNILNEHSNFKGYL